ncbi:hypothetical protein AMK17_37870 [Streptomyces sp. CB00072]|uniref:hypothetical protein n=1 Tax=Streptomyces TaxID=1883 RepID=UPI00093C4DA3|nr:hypothetical protein [Streptomyces sp. CB00072]OKI49428.1 hypothetical protein AMK17_37870 [Streptomyces sp. CB00072]
MALSISLVVLLGIIVVILVRTGYQRILPGTAVALFGFFLANTGIAPTITSAVSSLTGWISSF